MNQDQIAGTATDLTGKVKETIGSATGDTQTQNAGVADQLSGKVQKTIGDTKETVAAAALAGVVGLAILNTLRGKKA